MDKIPDKSDLLFNKRENSTINTLSGLIKNNDEKIISNIYRNRKIYFIILILVIITITLVLLYIHSQEILENLFGFVDACIIITYNTPFDIKEFIEDCIYNSCKWERLFIVYPEELKNPCKNILCLIKQGPLPWI